MTKIGWLLLGTSLLVACDKGPMKEKADQATSPQVAATAPGATPTTPPAVPGATVDGVKYGAGVTTGETVSVDALLADPKAYAGKTVRVEGMITDVCPKRGCWMNLAGSKPGEKLKFKVDDGEMVFPMDAKGKWAVAQGVVAVRDLTLEETKQKAEYEAKEYGIAYDPASITKPATSVRLDGTGAVLRDKK